MFHGVNLDGAFSSWPKGLKGPFGTFRRFQARSTRRKCCPASSLPRQRQIIFHMIFPAKGYNHTELGRNSVGFVWQDLFQQLHGGGSECWRAAQIGLGHDRQSRNRERPMRITWHPAGRRGPMTSAVQGVEGGKSVTLAGLHYSFCQASLKEQIEQERLERPAVASKLTLSFQGVVNCK